MQEWEVKARTMCGKEQERDELRARFTKWMEVLAYRIRRNYLRDGNRNPLSIPLDRVSEEQFAQAFAKLPAMKKQMLTMLFVLEMEPEKIASKLGCTVQNVYNQRSLVLKQLRQGVTGTTKEELYCPD
ncbi:sigma-70 family RNA polymerase sigma factor [Acutalibacter sp. 1XD8-33]|nr:sigma-70 family RNA polymerase sigma factor [Acutalibacter sp. 1XD8-33]